MGFAVWDKLKVNSSNEGSKHRSVYGAKGCSTTHHPGAESKWVLPLLEQSDVREAALRLPLQLSLPKVLV